MSGCMVYEGGLVVCGGGGMYERRILQCWGQCDGARRRVLVRYSSPYYSPDWCCVHCGDRWGDGRLAERPFQRGWRAKAIAKNRAIWDETPPGRVTFDDDLYPAGRAA